MRRVLVTSQKGGVGKTTTSINLAAAAAMAGNRVFLLDADPLSNISTSLQLAERAGRQTLRQIGIDLPGLLSCNVIAGLDVMSPYDEGGCTDEELGRLLQLIATPTFQDCYDCLIVDTPPFLGANPGQLLGICDEFMLVMRAEAMAYRTLPAFLELIQRARTVGNTLKMRGILLTLPEGEVPGCRWERELRGRFGTRILPQVIPHDEGITRSLVFGQILCHSHPESVPGQQYRSLVETLALTPPASQVRQQVSSEEALVLLSASLKNAAAALRNQASRRPVEKPASVPVSAHAPPAFASTEPAVRDKPSSTLPRLPETSAPDHRAAEPILPPESHPVTNPGSQGPRRRTPPPVTVDRDSPSHPAPVRPGTPTRVPVVPAPAVAPSARPAGAKKPAPAPSGGIPKHVALLWFGVAIIVGVGLRFLPIPSDALPVLVGFGVSVLILFLCWQFVLQPDEPRQKQKKGSRSGRRPAVRAHEENSGRRNSRKAASASNEVSEN
jgi:chromosome partitioning protein